MGKEKKEAFDMGLTDLVPNALKNSKDNLTQRTAIAVDYSNYRERIGNLRLSTYERLVAGSRTLV
jgi:hypothetical protein